MDFVNQLIWTSGIFSLLYTSYKIYQMLFAVYSFKLTKYLNGPQMFTKIASSDRYALITGSTDGIGFEYALQLANLGFSIIIVGRNDEKIEKSVQSIKHSNPDIDVKFLKVDFDTPDADELYDYIADQTKDIEISVLINNVGISYPHDLEFESVSVQLLSSLLNVNVVSVLRMCHIFIPRMIANSNRYRPIIVNVSSMSALVPMPYYSVYAATKAFVNHFTLSLSEQHFNDNIEIQSLLPGMVATKMTRIRNSSLLVASTSEAVEQSMLSVGMYKESLCCLSHFGQVNLLRLMPNAFTRFLMKASRDRFLKARQRSEALKKAKEAKIE